MPFTEIALRRSVHDGDTCIQRSWAQVQEFALAHTISGEDDSGKQVGNAKIIAAYMRETLVEERRPMMMAWADFADANNRIRRVA